MLIDTHCHLDAAEFDADREAVLDAARAIGVGRIVVPGVAVAGFGKLREQGRRHADLRCAYGIHPLYVSDAAFDELDWLDDWLAREPAVAVGEIGLDGYVANLPIDRQRHFYLAQLKLARRHGLPVILHVRRAVDLILSGLRRIEVPGGIAHAFNGSRQQAEILIRMGFKLGFGGSMTYSGSTRIRELAATLPLEAIVLETDAPDIPPEWAQGARNEPCHLHRYAQVLAELRGSTCEEVIRATTANAMEVLPGLH